MNSDVLGLLRAADPAAVMPEVAPEEHTRRRRAIMATPRVTTRRRRLFRRRITLIAVTGAVVLLGGAAAGALYKLQPIPQPPSSATDPSYFQEHGFQTEQEASDQYDDWTRDGTIELPAGATWRGYPPARADVETGVGAGASHVVWEAMGHWTKEWIAAAAAGDQGRASTAEMWVVRLRSLITVSENENQSGVDRATSRLLDAGVAEAQEGQFGRLARLCVAYTVPLDAHARSASHSIPSRYPGWEERLTGAKDAGLSATVMAAMLSASASETREDYRRFLRQFGLPDGVTIGDVTDEVEGPYFTGEGGVLGWLDARIAWWREWVAADAAGDRERIAKAKEAAARLRELLPLRYAVEPFVLEQTLDPAALRGFERLDALASDGDLSAIEDWLTRNAPSE